MLALPEASTQRTPIVETRPLPLPLRSASRLTVSGPVIAESPGCGSLLEMPVTPHTGAASAASTTATAIVTAIMPLLGGQIDKTLGVTASIAGGVVSTTVIVNAFDPVLPWGSVDEQVKPPIDVRSAVT